MSDLFANDTKPRDTKSPVTPKKASAKAKTAAKFGGYNALEIEVLDVDQL